MTTETHWKKFFNYEYLGSDSFKTGQELTLTIKECKKELVTGTAGKKEECLVCHFYEPYKPMILNRTNCKAITKVANTGIIEQWNGVKVTIFVKPGVAAFGSVVDALRIKETKPVITELDITPAINILNSCKTLEELKTQYTTLDKAFQNHAKVIALKDKLKTELK